MPVMSGRALLISDHAIDRYIERVAPALEGQRDAVRALILRLIRSEAHIRARVPDWVRPAPDDPTRGVDQWACLPALGIAFPMRNGWVLSTRTRATLSSESRASRNERRSRMQAGRRQRAQAERVGRARTWR